MGSNRYPFGTDNYARAMEEDVFAKVGESELLKTLPLKKFAVHRISSLAPPSPNVNNVLSAGA